jgi:hypothetical protein
MKTKSGLQVDLLDASTKRIPLGMNLSTGVAMLRLAHGAIGVRIISPAEARVTVRFDDKELVVKQVSEGTSFIYKDRSGAPLQHLPADSGGDSAVALSVSDGGEEEEVQDFSSTPPAEIVSSGQVRRSSTHGLVVVSVYYNPEDPTVQVMDVENAHEHAVFQLYAPGEEYNRAVANHFDLIVPTGGITKPWCSCCQ